MSHSKSFEKNSKNTPFDTSFRCDAVLEENTCFLSCLVEGLGLFGSALKLTLKADFWIKNSCQTRFFSNIKLTVLYNHARVTAHAHVIRRSSYGFLLPRNFASLRGRYLFCKHSNYLAA